MDGVLRRNKYRNECICCENLLMHWQARWRAFSLVLARNLVVVNKPAKLSLYFKE